MAALFPFPSLSAGSSTLMVRSLTDRIDHMLLCLQCVLFGVEGLHLGFIVFGVCLGFLEFQSSKVSS